jgi:hypothetical protein
MPAANKAALTAPDWPIAKVATGTPAGIWTIDSKLSTPRNVRLSTAGDDQLEAASLCTLGVLVKPVGGAVGRDDAGLVGDAEAVERMRDMLHRLPIGLAAHDDANRATSLAHVAPLCGEEGM